MTLSLCPKSNPVSDRYLFDDILPETMEFQEYRLTANAQELGGDIMFGTRLGFSGTPSNLLPEELKPCFYEKGDDGRMIHYLTQVWQTQHTKPTARQLHTFS